MAWVCVNKNNSEVIHMEEPEKRQETWWCGIPFIELPKGSIKKLIGRELNWSDEPVKLK